MLSARILTLPDRFGILRTNSEHNDMPTRRDKQIELQKLRLRLGGAIRPCISSKLPDLQKDVFPAGLLTSGLHEFVSDSPADQASALSFALGAGGYAAGISHKPVLVGSLAREAQEHGLLHGAGLTAFGIEAGHTYTVTARREQELLWSAEEAASSAALGALIIALPIRGRLYGFTTSRRLKLRIERSRTPVFIVRHGEGEPTAALARWRVKALPSREQITPCSSVSLIGTPRFHVRLERYSGSPPSGMGA